MQTHDVCMCIRIHVFYGTIDVGGRTARATGRWAAEEVPVGLVPVCVLPAHTYTSAWIRFSSVQGGQTSYPPRFLYHHHKQIGARKKSEDSN